MKVMIIPEDCTYDQYVLKPIVTAMLKKLGITAPNVTTCQDPRLEGIQQALHWSNILNIIETYKWKTDLFLLCVDRDNDVKRQDQLDNLEKLAAQELAKSPKKRLFLGIQAEQELEVWILAGHDLPKEWVWKEIRAERDPKEKYFVPFATQRGLKGNRNEGLKTLSKEAAGRYDRIQQLCPK